MSTTSIIYSIIGVIIGVFTKKIEGILLFGAVGYLLGSGLDLKKRMDLLEKKFSQLRFEHPTKSFQEPIQQSFSGFKEKISESTQESVPEITRIAPGQNIKSSGVIFGQQASHTGATQSVLETHNTQTNISSSPHPGDPTFDLIENINSFFVQGNVVVRIGLIVLFFGVAFLIKYAADRNMLPIELRLSALAVGAMAMLALGWRLRQRQPAYAVLIQGGAVGILYFTVFAAAKMYDLMPLAFSFVLMVCLVALSAVLALIQDAVALAVFGAIGGFLAPVFLSTGAGNHVALFSYYALLNAGILGIAWFKPWRALNLVGFAFTFVIGTTWGYRYYHPDYFATTEPFLILFFLFYAAISILYALRQPLDLKGFIDGPLVFGLPLLAFGLQSALVYRFEYGMSISAVALGIFYMAVAKILWNRRIEGMRMLTEAFLSMSVVFASLAVPLALDSTWTSGLWALEGAGIVWIGLRQRRMTARCFGLLLQLGAGISFIFTIQKPVSHTPVLNGIYMSCLILSLAGFASNFCLQYFKDRLQDWENHFHWALLAWGLLWWFGGGLHEIRVHALALDKYHMALAFISASCGIMGWLFLKLKWPDMAYPPVGLPFAAICISAGVFAFHLWPHPFYRWGFPAWVIVFSAQYVLLLRFETTWDQKLLGLLHQLSLSVIMFILTWELAWAVEQMVKGAYTWKLAAWGAGPGLPALLLVKFGPRISWPIRRFLTVYTGKGLGPIMFYLWCWTIFSCFYNGDPSPLPYAPLLNPLEMTAAFILLTILYWKMSGQQHQLILFNHVPGAGITYGVAASAFFLCHAMIARTIHAFGAVPYRFSPLFDSVVFQSALSIFWTLFSLAVMAGAVRKQNRTAWFIGATLLGVAVIKLFLIDLDNIGTVARIISFIVVGILMLVIGYFSPLPPQKTN